MVGLPAEPGHADCSVAVLCSAAGTACHAGGPDGLGPPRGHQKA